MKRFIILISVVLFAAFVPITLCENSSFAVIINDYTCLYRTPEANNDIKNIICVMESTYYVEILHTYNEEYYKVNYNGVSGYVLRKCVKKVNGAPNNPYPSNVKLKTVNNNIYLRTTPAKTNNTLSIIPASTESLEFVGYVYGEQVDDFRDNIWYYVKYLDIYGYVYGEYIAEISAIPKNIEQLNFVNDDYVQVKNPLSNGTCAIIVGVLTLPTMLILLLLYKKPKPNKKFKEQVIVVKEYDEKL